jgi:PAS domain S-box-containing protein
VNQAHADFYRLSREEMEYRKLWDFLPEGEARICRDGNIQVFQSGKQIRTEEWLHNASGEQRLMEIIKTPKLDAIGKVEYVVCSGSDITEVKRLELELREQNNLQKRAEEALRKKSWELEERVKELDCLYRLSRLLGQPTISRQDLMQSAVELIPFAWQYPDMTCARLLLEDEAFYSRDSRETSWKQSADIVVNGNKAGHIEVFYLRKAPEGEEGPFLREERELIENIAKSLGQYLEREQTKEALLKHALANEEFFLCYQTQIDLRTGRIVGLEALLRWEHPQKGIISPGEFIPVLENTGMIAAVDEWVIHRVCKQLGSWQAKGMFMKTSVNLSAQELNDEGTIEVVKAALEANGVRVESLEVEITESGLMTNVDRASRILQTLSSWGVRVALDDFGKGYSSLSYLQKLPVNIIKIDKGFVDGLPKDKDSVTLVQTIIVMAHNLGKEVLAEGVEREEQRQKLCELGCDYGQGFLWSRPQPAESLFLMDS